MELKDILNKRRSVRKFNDTPVSEESLSAVLDAALQAPSSRNSRSTHFIVVRDREVIERLAAMRDYGSAFVKGAPVFVLVAGDMSATDLWQVNCSISATILQLACTDAGLSSCWVHIEGRAQKQAEADGAKAIEWVREVVDIPENLGVLCGIALGYSDFEPAQLPAFDKASKIIEL